MELENLMLQRVIKTLGSLEIGTRDWVDTNGNRWVTVYGFLGFRLIMSLSVQVGVWETKVRLEKPRLSSEVKVQHDNAHSWAVLSDRLATIREQALENGDEAGVGGIGPGE